MIKPPFFLTTNQIIFRTVCDKVIDVIESAKARNFTDDQINAGLRINFLETDLVTAVSQASRYKCQYEENVASIKNSIDTYCVGDLAQYKGVLDGFMKSITTIDMKKDIAFLNFALHIMNDRMLCVNDELAHGYKRASDVLTRLKPPP